MLDSLQDALRPAGPEYVAMALLRLQAHYWRPDFTQAQAKALYADFMDDLSHLPADILDQAIATYRRDPEARFFPRPGQLLAVAEPILAERRRAYIRIEKAKDEPHDTRPIKRTQAEIDRIDALTKSAFRRIEE